MSAKRKFVPFSDFQLEHLELLPVELLNDRNRGSFQNAIPADQQYKRELKAFQNISFPYPDKFKVVPSYYGGEPWVMEFQHIQARVNKSRVKEDEFVIYIRLTKEEYRKMKEIQQAFFNQLSEKDRLRSVSSCLEKRIVNENTIYELMAVKRGSTSNIPVDLGSNNFQSIAIKFKFVRTQNFTKFIAVIYNLVR